MDIHNNLRAAVDQAQLMTKLAIFGVVVSGVIALLVLITGVSIDKFGGSDLFALAVIPFALAFLFSLAALIYGIMARAAAIEEEEKLLLEKRKEGHAAFNVAEDVRFTAGRSFDNYRKYAPYVFALLGAALTARVKDSFDPVQNIRGGSAYLRDLLDMFDQDVKLALAGYNAGEGAVIKHGRQIPPYAETQDYVRKVLRFYAAERPNSFIMSAR